MIARALVISPPPDDALAVTTLCAILGIIADKLHDARLELGWVSALDLQGRRIWIVDAHGDGKRFIVCSDEMLKTDGRTFSRSA